jgi:protoporphyrinogen oxidase
MSTQVDTQENTVAIVGGGFAGLAAAHDLGKRGFQVTLLEGDSELGGLASSFKIGGAAIERFYHFICRTDAPLLDLVEELGIGASLHWRQVRTSYFHNGTLYPFGTPLDLVRFNPVPFVQRLRFGLNILQSRYLRDWQRLDGVAAPEWLSAHIGAQAYQVIWDPLLRVKFAAAAARISAAWIWHRVWRVASSRRRLWERDQFGYLTQGSATLVHAFAQAIEAFPGVRLITHARVSQIDLADGSVRGVRLENGGYVACRHVISTVPLPVLLDLAPDLPGEYQRQLEQIKYIGVVCLLLRLRRPLTNCFWVNINDPAIAFNGFIEYTNLNPRADLAGSHIVYVPLYIAPSHARFRQSDQSLFDEYVAALQRVNPEFNADWIEEYFVFRERFAQAICHVDFARLVPPHVTPIPNLYITDSIQFYPEDRTISAAIRLGRQVAQIIAGR